MMLTQNSVTKRFNFFFCVENIIIPVYNIITIATVINNNSLHQP